MANLSSYAQRNLFGADIVLKNLLEAEDLCSVIQREIAPLVKDSDFESLYKEGGRPPVSPRILILTLLMQFLERLPDRSASQNLRYRLDWKIAFGLPVSFSGIHPTTLVYFRDRLIQSEQASILFDRIIEHLKACGLIKKGGKQRIDSTHIIGCVRELSRVELLHETLRLFCEDVESFCPLMDSALLELHGKYSEKISIHGVSDQQKKTLIRDAGLSMKALIVWGSASVDGARIQNLKSFTTLKTVFEQNFTDGGAEPELIKISTGAGHISSPHETEACYANKGKKSWIGYKGQVVETVNAEAQGGVPNFITHIHIEEATHFDGDCVVPIMTELQTQDLVPDVLYGDTHYNTAANIDALRNDSIDLKGPVQPVSRAKMEKNEGFRVDMSQEVVTCPLGAESKHFHVDPHGKVGASFPIEACEPCPRQALCKPEPRGKYYTCKGENQTLITRREQMKDPAYQKDLSHRNGIEGCISGLVRGQGWRRCRYRGKVKSQLQTKFTGAATNISRLHRYRLRQRFSQENITQLAA